MTRQVEKRAGWQDESAGRGGGFGRFAVRFSIANLWQLVDRSMPGRESQFQWSFSRPFLCLAMVLAVIGGIANGPLGFLAMLVAVTIGIGAVYPLSSRPPRQFARNGRARSQEKSANDAPHSVSKGNRQFSLRDMLLITAGVAVVCGAVHWVLKFPAVYGPFLGVEGAAALFLLVTCSGLCLVGSCRQRSFAVALALVMGVILLQTAVALSTWHTLGDSPSCGMLCLSPFAIVPAVACAVRSYRTSISISLVLILLWIPVVCAQAVLLARLVRMRTEVMQIASYAERVKHRTGNYPPDLSDYHFEHPEFEPLLRYWPPTPGDIYVVGVDLYEGDTTNREYSPNGWYYDPD